MALGKVINASRRPLDLASGRILAPGEILDDVDLDLDHHRQLILDKHLHVLTGVPPVMRAAPDRRSRTLPVAGPDEGVAIAISGHSYSASDAGSSGPATRWWSRLQRRRGWGAVTNRAVNGHTSIDQEVVMGGNGASKWTPSNTLTFLAFIFCITNDLLQGGADPRAIKGFKHALRAMILQMRAGAKIESSAFTTTGVWATGTATDYSGGTNIRTTAPGATASVVIAGPEATLLTYAIQDDTNAMAPFEVRVDGVLEFSGTQSNEAKNVSSGKLAHQPVRLTGLGAGNHTVEIRHSGTAGQTLFVDAIITPATNPGTIVVIKEGPMAPVGYPNYSDANLRAYHDAVDEVVADFPEEEVFTVDLWAAGWDYQAMAPLDTVHPNDLGMDFIADVVGQVLDERLMYRPGLNK